MKAPVHRIYFISNRRTIGRTRAADGALLKTIHSAAAGLAAPFVEDDGADISMPSLDAKLPEGWFWSAPDHASLLHAELTRELAPGHPLYGTAIEVVAHREGTDDILCRHSADRARFTVIHLTWLGRGEIAPEHPAIEMDGDFEALHEYERRFGT